MVLLGYGSAQTLSKSYNFQRVGKSNYQIGAEVKRVVLYGLGILTGKTAGPYWKVLGRPGMPV